LAGLLFLVSLPRRRCHCYISETSFKFDNVRLMKHSCVLTCILNLSASGFLYRILQRHLPKFHFKDSFDSESNKIACGTSQLELHKAAGLSRVSMVVQIHRAARASSSRRAKNLAQPASWDGIHQSFLVPSIFLLSFLPAPNSSAVYLVARAWKFLPTLSESPILLSFFQEILVRNLVCSLG
jgi:hypothetical protein